MADYPRKATKAELSILKAFPPLSEKHQKVLLKTSPFHFSSTFDGRPHRWLALYKKLLKAELPPHLVVVEDQERRAADLVLNSLKAKYKESIKQVEDLKNQLAVLSRLRIKKIPKLVRPKKLRSGKIVKEGALAVGMGDWHAAELIDPKKVNGLNKFNLEICKRRVWVLAESICKLLVAQNQQIPIVQVLLAVLGDLVNGVLREEALVTNQLGSIDEVFFVMPLLFHVIDKVVDCAISLNPNVVVDVTFDWGNHSRLTKDLQYKLLKETSTEYILALLAHARYCDNPNINVRISDGGQQIVSLVGYNVRLHHGFGFKYDKGVGGIEIPARKAIFRWNKTNPVIMDMFGHFHQFTAPRDFMICGALCGYNEYALNRTFEYDPPRQGATLIDARYGRRGSWPIYVGE